MGPNQTEKIIDLRTKSCQIGAILSILSYAGSLALVCVLSIAVGLSPMLAILVFWLGGGMFLCVAASVYELLGRIGFLRRNNDTTVHPAATA